MEKPRPNTRQLTAAEMATMLAARKAVAMGESLKPVAFRALPDKAARAGYLRAHL